MKTVTLYTEEEFRERWPGYNSKSTYARKNFHRFSGFMFVLPGWDIGATLDMEQLGPIATLKQKISDMTGAIAHIEAHPEEQ